MKKREDCDTAKADHDDDSLALLTVHYFAVDTAGGLHNWNHWRSFLRLIKQRGEINEPESARNSNLID